jgi:hypothetical protein
MTGDRGFTTRHQEYQSGGLRSVIASSALRLTVANSKSPLAEDKPETKIVRASALWVWLTLRFGVVAQLLLALQLAAPLDGSPTLPSAVNWLLLLVASASIALHVQRTNWFDRSILIACVLLAGNVFSVLDLGAPLPQWVIASKLGAHLSRSIFEIPWLALLYAWTSLGWAWLFAQLLLTISGREPSRTARLLCWILSLIVAVFGLRAVIGYATGSTALVTSP